VTRGLPVQAVTFLKRIKDVIEDPRRLLLDI
jgi:pyruvate/2-oxoglutarate dehydrogenase complex dihydrolipoamide acyltransferase (E2) component